MNPPKVPSPNTLTRHQAFFAQAFYGAGRFSICFRPCMPSPCHPWPHSPSNTTPPFKMAAEAAANILCFLAPWLSPWKCLVNTEAVGDDQGIDDANTGGKDSTPPLLSRLMGAGAVPDAPDANEATEAALRDLGNATTTLLASISSTKFPRSREEWVALLHASGTSGRAYVGAVVGFIRKADVWHVAVLFVLLLMITAKVWTKFLSELLENLFR